MGTRAAELVMSEAPTHRKPLGQWLLEEQVLARETLEDALLEQRREGGRLGDRLVASGRVSRQDVWRCLARQHGLPLVSLQQQMPELAAMRSLEPAEARGLGVLPLSLRVEDGQRVLTVAIPDPTRGEVLAAVRDRTGCRVEGALCDPMELERLLRQYDAVLLQTRDESKGRADPAAAPSGTTAVEDPSPGSHADVWDADAAGAQAVPPSVAAALYQELRKDVVSLVIEMQTLKLVLEDVQSQAGELPALKHRIGELEKNLAVATVRSEFPHQGPSCSPASRVVDAHNFRATEHRTDEDLFAPAGVKSATLILEPDTDHSVARVTPGEQPTPPEVHQPPLMLPAPLPVPAGLSLGVPVGVSMDALSRPAPFARLLAEAAASGLALPPERARRS
jgi:hypothetical protein